MTPRRITVVASEILGMARTGGAGTADSLLAVALARHGHDVELLVAPGRGFELTPEWTRRYAGAGVRVRGLEPPSVRPSFLAPTAAVYDALRADPPDVVVADDWRGLAYAPLRARSVGVALAETAFVTYCHGPARVLAAFAQKVPDTIGRFGEEVAERAVLELTDAVVSPSAWLLDWMRARRWPVPDSARVVQCLWQSEALDQPPTPVASGSRVRRLAFFGQLREGKGIRIFLASLDALDPQLLDGVELVFLGSETPRWTAERIKETLAPGVAERVASIRLETKLDRSAALDQLRAPGTLAIMPSLLDNSPNTVAECVEHGIPLLAARTGGIPELVAESDRERVLFEPTTAGLAEALRRALESAEGVAPARPAREPGETVTAWLELVDTVAPTRPRVAPAATRVAVVATGRESARRARRLAERTRSVEVEVVSAESRADGFAGTSADWVLVLDDEDRPEDGLLDALVAAQAASDADVVTAAVRPADDPVSIHLFLGDPGALGMIENHYGVVGLVRRTLALQQPPLDGAVDPEWPLFARLALAGARIVSIPEPLAVHGGKVGSVGDVPGEGLAVLETFEESRRELHDLPQLAATLAASSARLTAPPSPADGQRGLLERGLGVLRTEGVPGLARRVQARVRLGAGGRQPRNLVASRRRRARDPRKPLHVLHIGKSGGTALNHALVEHMSGSAYQLVFGGHTATLADIPAGEKFMFVVRDPISRFVSAFNGRLREDRPRYHYPWREEERIAFAIFKTPDQLATALSSEDEVERAQAEQAMHGIGHVNTPYTFWFGDEAAFRARLADLFFVGFTERLDEDFELLKRKLGLPPEARLPADETVAHKTPAGFADELGEVARANLERWYERDLAFVDLCRELAPVVNGAR